MVNYTNGNGCTASTATDRSVTINALPVPALVGATSVCSGSTGNVYSTDGGMSNYLWTVTGGTITAGGGATNNSVTVTWGGSPGPGQVTVNYTNGNGCTATSASVRSVTIRALPNPAIAGNASVCANSAGNIYSTTGGMTNYLWSVIGRYCYCRW